MRLDYSEPRRAQRSPSYQNYKTTEPRKGKGKIVILLVLAGVVFAAGFGSGWVLSEKATKQAFRAATEINKVEQPPQTAQEAQTQPAPQGAGTPPPAAGQVTPQNAQQGSAGHPTNQVPLSFFETLPKGQKHTVLGSGINEKQPSATPAKQEPSKASGFSVQAAAYLSSKDAEAMKGKLIAKGFQATVSETTINNRVWYRVRVGHHLEKEAAVQLAAKVGSGAKIVTDE